MQSRMLGTVTRSLHPMHAMKQAPETGLLPLMQCEKSIFRPGYEQVDRLAMNRWFAFLLNVMRCPLMATRTSCKICAPALHEWQFFCKNLMCQCILIGFAQSDWSLLPCSAYSFAL